MTETTDGLPPTDPPPAPPPTPAPHPLGKHGEPIVLYDGAIDILDEAGALLVSGEGSVRFVWRPSPRTVYTFRGALPADLPERLLLRCHGYDYAGQIRIFVPILGAAFGSSEIEGTIYGTRQLAPTAVSEVRFGVGNLPTLLGERLFDHTLEEDGSRRQTHWAGRVELAEQVWHLTIDRRANDRKVRERLQEDGGVDITHTASLVRRDGASFSADDARDALAAIEGFLALVRGDHAPALMAVGLDQDERVVWL